MAVMTGADLVNGSLLAIAVVVVLTGHQFQGASVYFVIEFLMFSVVLLASSSGMSIRPQLALLLIDGPTVRQLLVSTAVQCVVGVAVVSAFIVFATSVSIEKESSTILKEWFNPLTPIFIGYFDVIVNFIRHPLLSSVNPTAEPTRIIPIVPGQPRLLALARQMCFAIWFNVIHVLFSAGVLVGFRFFVTEPLPYLFIFFSTLLTFLAMYNLFSRTSTRFSTRFTSVITLLVPALLSHFDCSSTNFCFAALVLFTAFRADSHPCSSRHSPFVITTTIS